MLEKVKSLLKQGEIKEALRLLVSEHPDSAILLNQFQAGEKQFGLGILDFDSWQSTKNRIANDALILIAKIEYKHGASQPDFRAVNERLLEALKTIYTNRPKTLWKSDLLDFSLWFINAWEEDIAAIIVEAEQLFKNSKT